MKNHLYLPFWFIKSKFFNARNPLQSVIFINDNCNLACRHCHVFRRDTFHIKSFEQVRLELEYSYNLGSRFVDFEGGEPTLWRDGERDLNSLIALAKEIGFFSTTITTNAQNCFRGSLADSIWVSLDGLKPQHDCIRGEGAFDRAVGHIAASGHRDLSVNMTVSALNYQAVEDTIRFVGRNPVIRSISLNFYTPSSPQTQGNQDPLFLDWPLREKVIDQIIALKKNGFPIMNSVSGLSLMKKNNFNKHCWITNFILPDGERMDTCRGERQKVCSHCGYAMAGEMSSLFSLKPDTIFAGMKLRMKRK